MADINKTIKQLEADIDRAKRTGEILVYVGRATARDCLELLKEQQPRWISVEEALPKSIINKVLVYLEHEDLVGYIGFGHLERWHGEEIWFDLEHDDSFADRGYRVTHWMELPEKPKT